MWSNPAAWAALAAVLTFAAKLVFDVEAKRYDFWESRRAAIVRFRTDIEVTLKDLGEQLPGMRSEAYRSQMVERIIRYEAEGRPFRMFGAEASDAKAQDLITEFLVTLPTHSQRLVAEAIVRDRQMRALYRAMQSELFEKLDSERQVAAFDQWLESASKLSQALHRAIADMPRWSISARTFPGRLFGWDPEEGLSGPSSSPDLKV